MIQLETRHRTIIKDILARYPYQFYAFGSRVNGTAQPVSDLDLCYKGDIPLSDLGNLQEEFEESDLPFKVDLVAFDQCSQEFKKLIEKDLVAF